MDVLPSELDIDPNSIVFNQDFIADVDGVVYDGEKQYIPKGVYKLVGTFPPEQEGILISTDMTKFGDYTIVYPDIELWDNQECTQKPQVGLKYTRLYAKLNYNFYCEESMIKLRDWKTNTTLQDSMVIAFGVNNSIKCGDFSSNRLTAVEYGDGHYYIPSGVYELHTAGSVQKEITSDFIIAYGKGIYEG